MSRLPLFYNKFHLGTKQFHRHVSLKYIKNSRTSINKINRNIDIALEHFDGHYSRVYEKRWPSMRLGLLSPKKHCSVLNSFVGDQEMDENLIDLQTAYEKRLNLSRKSDQELERDLHNNIEEQSDDRTSKDHDDQPDDSLLSMFDETRFDDDDKPFVNRATTNLILDDYVPTSELIFHESSPPDPIYCDASLEHTDSDIQILTEPPFTLQEHLKIRIYPKGDWSRFEPPSKIERANLFSYYLLDGASIIPVLALNVQFDDVCADYCAAPGGKSLALMMTMKPKYLLCNDNSYSRLKRLHMIFKQYIPDINYTKSTLNFSDRDARKLICPDTFDKILVDVPCSNDRVSVESLENNIFKRTRSEERLGLPSMQCDILKAALRSLKKGGDAVYSTCTLSPLENDNVVKRSLLNLLEEGSKAKYAIMDMKETFRPLKGLFSIDDRFNFGQQIVPNICSNFGPMYISKIKRVF